MMSDEVSDDSSLSESSADCESWSLLSCNGEYVVDMFWRRRRSGILSLLVEEVLGKVFSIVVRMRKWKTKAVREMFRNKGSF